MQEYMGVAAPYGVLFIFTVQEPWHSFIVCHSMEMMMAFSCLQRVADVNIEHVHKQTDKQTNE
jgi:hypothetical protein